MRRIKIMEEKFQRWQIEISRIFQNIKRWRRIDWLASHLTLLGVSSEETFFWFRAISDFRFRAIKDQFSILTDDISRRSKHASKDPFSREQHNIIRFLWWFCWWQQCMGEISQGVYFPQILSLFLQLWQLFSCTFCIGSIVSIISMGQSPVPQSGKPSFWPVTSG